MIRTARTTSRSAARRTLAWSVVPVLLATAACTSGSDSGPEEQDQQQPPASQSPTPEPVRFADLPEPCSTLGEKLVNRIVPNADPKGGKTVSSTDTRASGTCLWSGLHGYQFRSLTVSLRRFESEVGLGSGDERAEGYAAQLVEEITGDGSFKEVDEARLAEPGEGGATSISYLETKKADGAEQRYRQQRVIARTGNIVVTIDYSGAGLQDADMPTVKRVKSNAEEAAVQAVEAVDASADSQTGGTGATGGNAGGGNGSGGGDA